MSNEDGHIEQVAPPPGTVQPTQVDKTKVFVPRAASTLSKVGTSISVSSLLLTLMMIFGPQVSGCLQTKFGMSKEDADKTVQQISDTIKQAQAEGLIQAKAVAEENDAKRQQELADLKEHIEKVKPVEVVKPVITLPDLTPSPGPKTELTIDQVKPWIDLFGPIIQKYIDSRINPAPPKPVDPPVTPVVVNPVNPPVVNPPMPPQPVPNPPTPPQPVPVITTGMRLVFTDSSKDPISATSVPVNRMIRCMVTGAPGQVGWTYNVHGNVETYELPLNLGYDFILKDTTSYIDITVFDATLNKVNARITANQAPNPPPNPNDLTPINTDPQPAPQPTPDGSQAKLSAINVYIAYDPKTVTPEITSIINATPWWQALQAAGNRWAIYTLGTQSPNGLKAIDYAKRKGVSPPYLVIENPATSQMIAAMTLPSNLDQVSNTLAKYRK